MLIDSTSMLGVVRSLNDNITKDILKNLLEPERFQWWATIRDKS